MIARQGSQVLTCCKAVLPSVIIRPETEQRSALTVASRPARAAPREQSRRTTTPTHKEDSRSGTTRRAIDTRSRRTLDKGSAATAPRADTPGRAALTRAARGRSRLDSRRLDVEHADREHRGRTVAGVIAGRREATRALEQLTARADDLSPAARTRARKRAAHSLTTARTAHCREPVTPCGRLSMGKLDSREPPQAPQRLADFVGP